MLFHFEFLEGKGIYNLHADVLAFFERAVTRLKYTDELFTVELKAVIDNSNDLEGKFKNVFIELNKNKIDKQFVYDALLNNNNVVELLTNTEYPLVSFPSPLYDTLFKNISSLYLFLWSSTIGTNTCVDNYGGLKQHYVDHDAANLIRTRRLCPFCGLRKLENPKDKRNEYDHYLDKKSYPYLAVNFFNLVPMCDGCNKRPNKGTKDMIINGLGIRQLAYFPYHAVDNFTISLTCTDLFMPTAKWSITTDSVAADRGFGSWKSIFRIDTRYENHITDEYTFWIESFAKYYEGNLPSTVDDLKAKIHSYVVGILNTYSNTEGHFLHIEFWNFFIEIPNNDLELIIDLMEARQIYASA